MEQIVLDINLRYVLATLDMSQRGEILTALFEGAYNGEDEAVKNIFCYFALVSEKKAEKRRKMCEISLLGVEARRKKREEDFAQEKILLQSGGEASVDHTVNRLVDQRLFERKEAKESIYNKNNIFYQRKFFSENKGKKLLSPPDVQEVRDYVEKNGYKVNAETFVDFYESRGWQVGTTPILNWQATVRLWHRRAVNGDEVLNKKDDETYWHELMESKDVFVKNDVRDFLTKDKTLQNVSKAENPTVIDLKNKPFERFMNRVEKYDILGDENE